ncbi:MAG: hypothetical protein ABFS17_03590 [Chloroflexota bacterium]
MISAWVSPPTIIFISLGFAGLLGELIRQLRSRINKFQLAAALALIGLVLLPPLSLPPVTQWFGWAAAGLVILLFAYRPQIFPAKIFSEQFAWQYASFAMFLAAIWNLVTGPSFPFIPISISAALAAFLSWKRSQEPPN